MKVFINCDCEILSATLEKILSNSITSQSDADIIICEREFSSNKPLFIIDKDITQPFSEAELKQKLSEFLNKNEFLEKKTGAVPEKKHSGRRRDFYDTGVRGRQQCTGCAKGI